MSQPLLLLQLLVARLARRFEPTQTLPVCCVHPADAAQVKTQRHLLQCTMSGCRASLDDCKSTLKTCLNGKPLDLKACILELGECKVIKTMCCSTGSCSSCSPFLQRKIDVCTTQRTLCPSYSSSSACQTDLRSCRDLPFCRPSCP